MRIDGKAIAEKILSNLTAEVTKLKERGVVPTLAVILVGEDSASLSYIKQKQKAAEIIGANVILEKLPATTSPEELLMAIKRLNEDPSVHGLIVQKPLPPKFLHILIYQYINILKDVDGFAPNSLYEVPVAAAVLTILKEIHPNDFSNWIKNQCSVVLGKGETAGRPIANALGERGCMISVVHSQTANPTEVIKKMNIVVSCVGKERVVTAPMLAPNTILIGVGIWRDETGKLRGDYEESEIEGVAAYYTPTPGGVGPVNVACLMQNLVLAAQNKF